MNILIATALFPPEPVVSAKLSEDIAVELHKNGHQVTVIAPPPTRPLGFNFNNSTINYPFNIIRTKSYTCAKSSIIGRFRESYSFGIALKKHLLANPTKYQRIYASTWPLLSQYILVKTAKRLNIPVVNHIQDVYPESLGNKIPLIGGLINQLLLPLDRYILKNSYRVIAISEQMQGYLIKTRGLSKEIVSSILNWQNEEEFLAFHQNQSNELKSKKEPFTFMYLGNIGPVAGVEHLIDSFKKANLNNCRLIIAGSGSMRKALEEKVATEKIENVFFMDVPNGQVPATQQLADVLLLPMKKGSGGSSIPSKLPAYMFSKKPVIACVDVDSETARCINQAQCGQVIEPENTEQLRNAFINYAQKSKEELIQLGENGFQFAIRYLSKSANLNKLINVILG